MSIKLHFPCVDVVEDLCINSYTIANKQQVAALYILHFLVKALLSKGICSSLLWDDST